MTQNPDDLLHCREAFEKWAIGRPALESSSAKAEAWYIWQAALSTRANNNEELIGTMECPVCGKDTPHSHALGSSLKRALKAIDAARSTLNVAIYETRRSDLYALGQSIENDLQQISLIEGLPFTELKWWEILDKDGNPIQLETRQPTANNEKLREAAQSLIDTLMRYTHYQMVWKDIDKLKAALADSPVQKPAENEQVSKLRGALKRILARDYGIFGMTSRERLDFIEAIVKDALAETDMEVPLNHPADKCNGLSASAIPEQDAIIRQLEEIFRPEYNQGTMTAGELHMVRRVIAAMPQRKVSLERCELAVIVERLDHDATPLSIARTILEEVKAQTGVGYVD